MKILHLSKMDSGGGAADAARLEEELRRTRAELARTESELSAARADGARAAATAAEYAALPYYGREPV